MANSAEYRIGTRIRPADLILVFLLLITALGLVFLFRQKQQQEVVKVFYRNNLIKTFSLNEDLIYTIDDGIVMEIRDSRIRMVESNCKRQYCVDQGWTDLYPLICVPNEVLIKIEGKGQDDMLITK